MVAEGYPIGQQIRFGLSRSPPKTPASYHHYAAFAGMTTNFRSASTNFGADGPLGADRRLAAASPSFFPRSPIVAMTHLQDQPPLPIYKPSFSKKTLFRALASLTILSNGSISIYALYDSRFLNQPSPSGISLKSFLRICLRNVFVTSQTA